MTTKGMPSRDFVLAFEVGRPLPALPIREEAHEDVESVLREAGLLTVREVG